MTTFGAYLGKGLDEPCPPYRHTDVFGAPLNEPDAGNWNCVARIMGPTTSFDLSGISQNREVVVALLTATSARQGTYKIRFRYYKLSPHTKLFEYTYTTTPPEGGWFYAYAYIGRVSWEINENGDYYVEIKVTGPDTLTRNISFSVSGIEEEEELPLPVPVPAENLSQAFLTVRNFFYNLYQVTEGWIWPFSEIAAPFYSLSKLFGNIALGIENLVAAVNALIGSIGSVLSWEAVWSRIISYVPNLIDIGNWFYDWVTNVASVVTSWWPGALAEVRALINSAISGAQGLLGNIERWLGELQSDIEYILSRIPALDGIISWWRNWQGNIHTYINTWWTGKLGEVQSLIDSSIRVRFPFYDDMVQLWGSIAAFFADPVEYIWDRFADWFLGPEE